MAGRKVPWKIFDRRARKALQSFGQDLVEDTSPPALLTLGEFSRRMSADPESGFCPECVSAQQLFSKVRMTGGCTQCRLKSIYSQCFSAFVRELQAGNARAIEIADTTFRDRNALMIAGKTVYIRDLTPDATAP